MKKQKHVPPSRIKYESEHPTVSIRVSQEVYEGLWALRETSGKSWGDVLREALDQQLPSAKNAYENGFNKAKKKYAVEYKCSICGGDIALTSDEAKKAAAQYMREHGWHHCSCAER